jgi:hypothetical protein
MGRPTQMAAESVERTAVTRAGDRDRTGMTSLEGWGAKCNLDKNNQLVAMNCPEKQFRRELGRDLGANELALEI